MQQVDRDRVGTEDVEALEQIGGDVVRGDAPSLGDPMRSLRQDDHVGAAAAVVQPAAEYALALTVLACAVEDIASQLEPGVEQLGRCLLVGAAVERRAEHEHGEIPTEWSEPPVPHGRLTWKWSLVAANRLHYV